MLAIVVGLVLLGAVIAVAVFAFSTLSSVLTFEPDPPPRAQAPPRSEPTLTATPDANRQIARRTAPLVPGELRGDADGEPRTAVETLRGIRITET
jgi:hypothetical protein